MQKVEGSSPFSRFRKSPAKAGFFVVESRLIGGPRGIFSASFRIGSGNRMHRDADSRPW